MKGASMEQQAPFSGHEAKCLKILKDLQSLQSSQLIAHDSGFLQFDNYRTFVPNPISLEGVAKRVNGKGSGGIQKYTHLNEFALDIRRIFGNFIRYNYFADAPTTKLRKDVVKVLFKFEQCWFELIKSLDQASPGYHYSQPVQELKWGLVAFEDMVKSVDTDNTYLIDSFMHPIHLYISDPKELKEYRRLVATPISVAEIVSKLIEAVYDNIEQVKDDMDMLVNNCSTYWSRKGFEEQGKDIIQKAMKLQQSFLKSLNSSEAALMAKPVANGPLSLMPRYIPVQPLPSTAPSTTVMPTLTLSLGAKNNKSSTTGNKAKPVVTKQTPVVVQPAVAAVTATVVAATDPAQIQAQAALESCSRDRAEWEVAAEEVWKNLKKHPYVDLLKPTVIADFWRPVIQVVPSIAADYLATISVPMDMSLLITQLFNGSIRSPQEFTDSAVRIFQNAIDYNSNHEDSSYALHLVPRCEALRRYTYWQCLEALPLEDDSSEVKDKSKQSYTSAVGCPLTISASKEQRAIRDSMLSNWYIHDTGNAPYTECNKLLKDLQRGRNKSENIQISWFAVPVNEKSLADYSVYVRNPMDLSTVKYRLDGTLPSTAAVAQAIDRSAQRYQKYSEFVADLRRVFTNAIKYNRAHQDTDTTGDSKAVHDAACMLQERLENLLGMFTVNLAERIDRMRIANAENQKHQAELQAKREKEEAEAREFEKKVLEELKATDHVFAADYDLEQKRKLTELQLKEHILQQQKAMLEATTAASAATMEDLGRDIGVDDTSTGGGNMSPLAAGAAGALFGAGMNVHGSLLRGLHIPPIPGFGQDGKVPMRYAHLVELKKGVRDRAWAYWQGVPGAVTQTTGMTTKKHTSSNGGHKSGNGSVKKEGDSIRITGSAYASASEPTEVRTDSSMDVVSDSLAGGSSPKRSRTTFSLQPSKGAKLCRVKYSGTFAVDLSDHE